MDSPKFAATGRCAGSRWIHVAAILSVLVGFGGIACVAQESGAPADARPLERGTVLQHRYLNIPVRTDAPRRTISLLVDGEIVRAFEVELADGPPDFWAFLEIGEWKGRSAILRLDPAGVLSSPEAQSASRSWPLTSDALNQVRFSDEIEESASLYREPWRPQFHFTTKRGWLNDPNGPIYAYGEYHLFYQLQPYSLKSFNGDKAWGHAVSRDFVHWTELPVALHPDRTGGVWSGSSVIDTKNLLGLQTGPEPPMLLFYTATGRSAMNPKAPAPTDFLQAIAFSNDRGLTWTRYAHNPILANVSPQNRDPQVFWHEPSRRWVMLLYVGTPYSNPGNHYQARIFTSDNLRDWTYRSAIDGLFDCPALFEVPIEGSPSETRWIAHSASMKYRVGRFDGETFVPETDFIASHQGRVGESAYAPLIFRNTNQSRPVQIGWLADLRFSGSRQAMTFPCELVLRRTSEGLRLRWSPVAALENLHGARSGWRGVRLDPARVSPIRTRGRYLDLQAQLRLDSDAECEISVRGRSLTVHAASQQITFGDYSLPIAMKDGRVQLRLLVDETSWEIFAEDGLVYLPLVVAMAPLDQNVSVTARGGAVQVDSLDVFEVKSIWPTAKGAAR